MYHIKFVRELFNRISSTYDKVNTAATLGMSKIIRKQILSSNLKKSNQEVKVLDLMCGN
jgi:ubiquinone/menaquinone biosynthesis C-methylase UbiE